MWWRWNNLSSKNITKKVILKKMNFHLQESPSPLVGFFYPPWKTINKLLNSFFVLRFIMRRLFFIVLRLMVVVVAKTFFVVWSPTRLCDFFVGVGTPKRLLLLLYWLLCFTSHLTPSLKLNSNTCYYLNYAQKLI